ncbi:DUF5011 domain-containing protein [Hymenobacter sp.]|uniref:DUF5011 domain-containing protein n=1 Tax=Hymenobacter sp. TaxID=1898978 RepID=UPI00286D5DBF|nr:DUF5011 domain-containing protein [Hymenobacter sp.]
MKVFPFFGLSLLSLALALTGCKKDETDNLSRIKSYPAIDLRGDEYYVLNVGETFTEPGVTATLAGEAVEPTIVGTVNTATPGIYRITYSAANTEGDEVTAVRSVIITNPAVNNLDQSGDFQRTGFALSPVTKVGSKGLYRLDNFGFTNAPNLFPAYFVQTTPNSIVVPSQTIEGLGFTNFASVSSAFTAGRLTRITYSINAPAVFGTPPRTANRL